MLIFSRFLLVLGTFLGVFRLCYVEDPQLEVVVKSSSEAVAQDNVKSENSDHDITVSKSSEHSTSPPSSSSSLLSSSSSEMSVLSSSSSSVELANGMSSVEGITTSELEQLVLPTVAPATPQFDVEIISTSVLLKSSNTETVSQGKAVKETEKRVPDSKDSNIVLNSIDKGEKKTEDDKEALMGKQEGLSDLREKKEKPLKENVQDETRDTSVTISFIPSVKRDAKEVQAEEKVDDSKVVIQTKEEENLEPKKEKELHERLAENVEEIKDKAEKKVEERKEEEIEEVDIESKKETKKEEKQEKHQEKQQENKEVQEVNQEERKGEKLEEKPKENQEKEKEKKDTKESQEDVSKEKSELLAVSDDKDEDSITAKLKQAEQETNTPSEDMPSFDEFKRQLQQEEEKQKSMLKKQKDEQTRPLGTQPKIKPKKIKERKQNNYASVDCGAKILSTNPEATNAFSILQDNRDIYMLNPCSAKIWFIVELCDTAQVRRIDIANFELFSSTPESFRVFVSGRYPTRDWALLGTFQARDERTLQSFPLEEPIYAKYFKVEMLSHFAKEHYCPISLFRVFGTSMMEELEDHEAGGQDDSDSVDHDDELVPVLPHDPSAKSEDKPKEPNILATVGDTLMNMVKHAAEKLTGVIKDNKENNTINKDSLAVSTAAPTSSIVSSMVFKQQQEQAKHSIVTLIPSEEDDENIPQVKLNKTISEMVNGTNKTLTGSPDKPATIPKNKSSSFYDKINLENSKGSKSTASFPSCKMLVRMLGHSGFGCLMGRVLYSKRGKQHGFTPKDKASKTRQITRVNDSVGVSADHDKTSEKSSNDENSKETKENENQKENENSEENEKERKTKTTRDSKPVENISSESNSGNVDSNRSITETLESSSDISEAARIKEEIQATATINSTSVHPSLMIEPSGSQRSEEQSLDSKTEATPSLGSVSLLKVKASSDATESTTTKSGSPDSKPTREQVKKSEEYSATPSEPIPSQTKDIEKDEAQSKVKEDISEKSDVSDSKELSFSSAKESLTDTKGSCITIQTNDHSLVQPLQPTTPSECVAPTVMSNPKDVDVLEFKILDSTGREGTAHPEKPVNQEKPAEPVLPEKPDHSSVAKVQEDKDKNSDEQDEKKDSKSVSESKKTYLENSKVDELSISTVSVVESSKADQPAIASKSSIDQPKEPPTTPPPLKAGAEDSVQPLPPPPVLLDNSLSPPSSIEVSLVDEVNKPSSSAVNNQGLPSSVAQKESIFMRLTNRIKALEQNLTLSTLYMERLNQKYRRIVEDMQKNFDKRINLLTNATIKAENMIKSQKEQISQLQAKVNETKKEMDSFSKKLANLSKDVMERHIIGLFLEVIFIVMLFIVFRRWDRARFRREMVRDAFRNGSVPTSQSFTTNPEARKTMLTNGHLSAREQLHRSFSTPVVPENLGAVNDNLMNQQKDDNCQTFDVKKKRSRKRPKSAFISNESISSSKSAPELTNQGSVVNTAAGLLFSPARGLLNGLPNSWRFTRSNSLDDTQINRKPDSCSSPNDRLQKAKSLDVIHENTERVTAPSINKKGRIPTPPPPPPPKSYGMNQKRLPGQLPSSLVNRKGRGLHGNYH